MNQRVKNTLTAAPVMRGTNGPPRDIHNPATSRTGSATTASCNRGIEARIFGESTEALDRFAPELVLLKIEKMTIQSTPTSRSRTTPSSLGDIAPLRINRQSDMIFEPRAILSHHSPVKPRIVGHPEVAS